MKDHSQAAIQFSGYPLSIADRKQKLKQQAELIALKPKVNNQTTFIQKNKITNDPKNWDLDWFTGYE